VTTLYDIPPGVELGSRKTDRERASHSMSFNAGTKANRPWNQPAPVAFAIVHHANQYIISDGYTNRSGIASAVGSVAAKRGLTYILELHRTYGIPANIHISGTLLEALAWHQPQCLALLKKMYRENLIEIVGSAYSQNIMRYFRHEYNIDQLNEQLDLCGTLLDVQPRQIKSFWPPERVWDTRRMARVLRDPALRNEGFEYVFVDDRLLLPITGGNSPRHRYDRKPDWDAQHFYASRIEGGQGLIALPIAANLRHSIPPRTREQQQSVEKQLRWIGSLSPALHRSDFIAIYADDMEKPAAIGWDPEGPAQFEGFLRWLSEAPWVRPVKVSEWAASARIDEIKDVEGGTYAELATEFGAGELYEKWYFDPRWDPYQVHFAWAERRVRHLETLGANPALIELANKHLLASSWETAWHTPVVGAHGDSNSDGGPSGASRAAASHSRHAAMIAEAAHWQFNKDEKSHCYLCDIDHDGEEELILKNRELFAVVSPSRGGRLVALFAVAGDDGMMVIGNPTDDWNLKEELNDYMDIPPNHPGALADVGFEHDFYSVGIVDAKGGGVQARLRNQQSTSAAFGLVKEIRLDSYEDHMVRVSYVLPEGLSGLDVEFGLSPDYLSLLRKGRSILEQYDLDGARCCSTDSVVVWVKPDRAASRWGEPYQSEFGHGRALRLLVQGRRFGVSIGVQLRANASIIEANSAVSVEI
jgi:hypothetical protein